MKVINQDFQVITEYDLTQGQLVPVKLIREDATPIDNKTKWAWADEDYEDAQMYIPNNPTEESPEPTQLDRIEAQVTYTAMMTDTLLEV